MKKQITEKLFFKKYDHRVIINVADYQRSHRDEKGRPHPAVLEYLIDELEPNKGVKYRHEHSYYWNKTPARHTIYFADKRILELILSKFADHVVSLCEPVSDAHSEAMDKEKVIVRKSFFHGKYPYCVRTSRKYVPNTHRTTSKHMEDMVKWCEETFPHLVSGQDYYIYKGWNKSFFFKNPADVLLMKLTWGEDIDRTERIKLIEDLPENASND